MQMNPVDNLDNLPPDYIDELKALPERKRKRFLEGIWQDDLEGALWTREMIDKNRVVNAPPLIRVVVGVDPSGTSKTTSDDTGIVAVGIDKKGHLYVMEDNTQTQKSPAEWAQAGIDTYERQEADRVIGEQNYGGDMVKAMFKNIDENIPYSEAYASRNKIVRAEPISELYELERMHHVGTFPELEDEMCNYTPQMMIDNVNSPNRLDALVWAATFLTKSEKGHVRVSGGVSKKRKRDYLK